MTDELDPQTQQHIDDSADTIDDCDTSTSSDGGIDAAVEEAPAAADEAADANVAAAQDKEDQLEQPDPSDTEPKAENAPQAAGPIEVSSEEELDAVMDPALYTGRCAQQVERFLSECAPLLADAQSADGAISL